ncbi:hypothetical protein L1987_13562 [Smallanthus sonchifolius]|uniref:Uncharacterized protein n=1 Tax=Smallanthus sonchifolius TaxID=185202 RepID=A0ACB9JGV8_9ASTR|nr:hypothetical protein L1987_13562 [Smallanthus sonchifolius]
MSTLETISVTPRVPVVTFSRKKSILVKRKFKKTEDAIISDLVKKLRNMKLDTLKSHVERVKKEKAEKQSVKEPEVIKKASGY